LDDSPQIACLGRATRNRCCGRERSPAPKPAALLHFLMRSVLTAGIAKLLGLQTIRMLLLVFCRRVVAVLTVPALQRNDFPHHPSPFFKTFCLTPENYSMISVTAPAPTVWPPSRIANRNPFSSATGVINDTSQLTLSPGITISTPSFSFTSPVTSVVRK